MNPTNDIHDIKGLVPVPYPWWVWLLVAFIVGAAVIIIWVIWGKRHATTDAPPPRLPTPLEVALAALERLRAENPAVEVFYTRLSGIVRHYIEGRFGLRAPERTTEEFLAEASLPAESMASLGVFLQEADLVKFARHRPGPADVDRVFAAAERFVRESGEQAPRLSRPEANEGETGERPVPLL